VESRHANQRNENLFGDIGAAYPSALERV